MYSTGDYVVIQEIPETNRFSKYNGLVAKVIGKPYSQMSVYEVSICGLEEEGSIYVESVNLEPYDENEDCYHDSHYRISVLEPILVMQSMFTHEEFIGFLKGNILKYRLRLGHKDDIQKEMDKIQRYEQWLAEAEEGKKITI